MTGIPITSAIIQRVSVLSGVSVAEMMGTRRRRSVAYPRFIAIYLVDRHCTWLSLKSVGRVFGGRDHTTIANALRRAPEVMAKHPEMKRIHDDVVRALFRESEAA